MLRKEDEIKKEPNLTEAQCTMFAPRPVESSANTKYQAMLEKIEEQHDDHLAKLDFQYENKLRDLEVKRKELLAEYYLRSTEYTDLICKKRLELTNLESIIIKFEKEMSDISDFLMYALPLVKDNINNFNSVLCHNAPEVRQTALQCVNNTQELEVRLTTILSAKQRDFAVYLEIKQTFMTEVANLKSKQSAHYDYAVNYHSRAVAAATRGYEIHKQQAIESYEQQKADLIDTFTFPGQYHEAWITSRDQDPEQGLLTSSYQDSEHGLTS